MNKDDFKINMLMRSLPDKKFKTAMENYNNYIKSDTPEKREKFRNIWVKYVRENIYY